MASDPKEFDQLQRENKQLEALQSIAQSLNKIASELMAIRSSYQAAERGKAFGR